MKDYQSFRLVKCLTGTILASLAILSISTASSGKHRITQNTSNRTPSDTSVPPSQNCAEAEQLRKNVQRLTAELDRLKRKVAELEKDRQLSAIQDQLNKEEDRAGAMQARLLEISEKQTNLQTRIDQIDFQLRPENIDQSLAGVGSLRPEDAREAVRRRFTNEKQRLQTQMDLLRQERIRLQASLATSDATIQRLRLKLSQLTQPS